MTSPSPIIDPAVPRWRAAVPHPVAALVLAAVLLRYALPGTAQAVADHFGAAPLMTALDLVTLAMVLLGLGMNLARSQARRKVAERGPEAGVLRARRLTAWITPLFLTGLVYGMVGTLPLNATIAYITPILFALSCTYAHHLQQAADDHARALAGTA